MSLIQINDREYTPDLENTGYMIDLLRSGYKQRKADSNSLDDYSEYRKERFRRGIPLEIADKMAKKANKENLLHVNDFGKSYPSQHGLDNVTFSYQLKKRRFGECTNPKWTTIMGTEIWLEKLSNFFIEDPNHEGQWTITVSYPEHIPFAIQILLDFFGVQVIRTGYVTDSRINQVSCMIFSQISGCKNWLDKKPLLDTRNEHDCYYLDRVELNKLIVKHNRKADKRRLIVQKLRNKSNYKELKQEAMNLLNAKSSQALNLILGRIRTKPTNDKALDKTPTDSKSTKQKVEIISQKSLCLSYLAQDVSAFLDTHTRFFSEGFVKNVDSFRKHVCVGHSKYCSVEGSIPTPTDFFQPCTKLYLMAIRG